MRDLDWRNLSQRSCHITELSQWSLAIGHWSFPLRHFLPLSALAGLEDGVAHVLCLQRVAERWAGRFAGLNSLEKIGDLVHKAVFVADLQAGHPPILHVRMIAIADMNGAPAAEF